MDPELSHGILIQEGQNAAPPPPPQKKKNKFLIWRVSRSFWKARTSSATPVL